MERNRFRPMWLLLLALLVPSAVSRAEEPALELVRDDWQVLEIENQRIGYAHIEYKRQRDTAEPKLIVVQTSEMKFQRFGRDIQLQTTLQTLEAENGDLESFFFEMRNPPNQPTAQSGTVRGDRLELELTVNGRRTRKTVAWTAGTKSPLYQERAFEPGPIRDRQMLTFSVWQPELSQTATIKLRGDMLRETALFGGKKSRLMRVGVENSALPTLKSNAYLDERGRWIKSETDFFGKTLVTHLVPAEEALKQLAGTELDLAIATVVRAAGPRTPFESPSVTYRVKLADDDPAKYFLDEEHQRVKSIDARTIELTVTAHERPPATVVARTTDEMYLRATEFLQSDDRRVRDLARNGAADSADPLRAALSMERYVHQKIRVKGLSTALASAAEVAETLEGDCTEHAMLLAAMLRAERIPSRVCVGLVHAPQVSGFAGHMWTEAWIRDRWVPLDATLAKGGIGRGHLKISHSDMGENAPAPITSFLPLMKILGKLQIEIVRQ